MSKRKRGAFTLVELLVVVAIIARLVTILMPSLMRANELARRAVCATNLHNIHVSAFSYAAEHDGWHPPQRGGGFDEYAHLGFDPEKDHPPEYHGNRASFQLGPHVYSQALGVYSDSRNKWWGGKYYITHWWRAMESYLGNDPNMLVCPSSHISGNVDTEDNGLGYNTYHWWAWTWSNEARGYYAGMRAGQKRLANAPGDDPLMSDLCLLTRQGWYITNHVDRSGEWMGSSREGGRAAAGANHLYVAGGVNWVEEKNLVMAPLYYDDFVFAEFPSWTGFP